MFKSYITKDYLGRTYLKGKKSLPILAGDMYFFLISF